MFDTDTLLLSSLLVVISPAQVEKGVSSYSWFPKSLCFGDLLGHLNFTGVSVLKILFSFSSVSNAHFFGKVL